MPAGVQVNARPRTVKRDPKAKWPQGWELEAKRLAVLYTRAIKGSDEHDAELAKRRLTGKELEKLSGHAVRLAQALSELVDSEDADWLVRMRRARSSRQGTVESRRDELDHLLAYVAEIRRMAASCADIAVDLEGAAQMPANSGSYKGNQSTLVLRFTIAAAAPAYTKLFGKAPGRSRSDYGTFGLFVMEVIDRIPREVRPRRPSPSAVSDVVGEWWRRRQPVAR